MGATETTLEYQVEDFANKTYREVNGTFNMLKCCCRSDEINQPELSSKIVCSLARTKHLHTVRSCRAIMRAGGYHSWNNMPTTYKDLQNYGKCVIAQALNCSQFTTADECPTRHGQCSWTNAKCKARGWTRTERIVMMQGRTLINGSLANREIGECLKECEKKSCCNSISYSEARQRCYLKAKTITKKEPLVWAFDFIHQGYH